MNASEALRFLERHQPMPPDSDLTEEVMQQYDAARKALESEPDDRAVPLLLNSFGDGDLSGIYQMVATTLRIYDRELVVGSLEEALESPIPSVRAWCTEIALEYPDRRLVPAMLANVESEDPTTRFFAAAFLIDNQFLDGASTRLLHAVAVHDPEVRERLENGQVGSV